MRYLGMLVHRSLDVESLLDGYRIGHAALWRRCARTAFERVTDQALLQPVLEQASVIVFRFINTALRRLREEYEIERLAQVRWLTARKLAAIHELLQPGEEPVAAELTKVLGYDVSRRHIGFVVHVRTAANQPHDAGPATTVVAERLPSSSPRPAGRWYCRRGATPHGCGWRGPERSDRRGSR